MFFQLHRLAFIVSILALLFLAACTSGYWSQSRPVETGNTPLVTAPPEFPALPSPIDILEPVVKRSPSYTEPSLVALGSSYYAPLPNANITITGDLGVFSPNYSGNGLAGAAYGIYQFDVSGFDREDSLYYGFASPPADYENVWLGIASYNSNRWHWYQADATGYRNLYNLYWYTSPGGLMYVAWVVLGDSDVELAFTRIGPQQVRAGYAATPFAGVAPLAVMLNASGSSTDYGSITKFEWDLDGDGVFDVDTGSTPDYSFDYDEGGMYLPAVRVTSSLGEFAVDSDNVDVYDPWEHTWGGSGIERFQDIALDSTEAFYATGYTNSDPSNDVLLARFALDGTPQWVRAWGSGDEDDEAYAIDVNANGIFVAGKTSSYLANGRDMLIQRWDKEGNVIWSRTFDHVDYTYEQANAIRASNSAVYVAGKLDSAMGDACDAVLLSFDLNGGLNWARSFGGSETETAVDVQLEGDFSGDVFIHVVGYSTSTDYGIGERNLLYAIYKPDGVMQELRSWCHTQFYPDPKKLQLPGMFSPGYIVGTFEGLAGDSRAMLLRLNGDDDPVASAHRINSAFFNDFTDIAIIGGQTYIVGNNYDTEQKAFLLVFDFLDNIQARSAWNSDSAVRSRFYGVSQFPGSGGVVLLGSCPDIAGQQYSYPSVNSINLAGVSWVSYPLEQDVVNGVVTMPSAGGRDVEGDGMWDSGGGNEDALIFASGLL